MSVSITRKEAPRRAKRIARRRKALGIVAALFASVSLTTWAGVEAAGFLPINIQSATNQTEGMTSSEEPVRDVQETSSGNAVENVPFRKGYRTGKDRVWLNPDQMKEGQEAPLFIALCFHEIRDDKPEDELAVHKQSFRNIIRELKSQGFWFLDSNDIIAIKKGEMEQPEKAVFISFDDGYEDNYTNAFPVLKEENVKATFFLPSSYISQPNRMNVNQLKEMAAYGMCFGSHTVTHEELDHLTDEQIMSEMNESKYVLQHDYGIAVESIAYPGGFQSELTLQEAAKNYEVGFIASMDANTQDTFYTIHRYGVFRWNDTLDSILNSPQP